MTLFSNSNIFSYAEAELFGVLTVRIQFQWSLEYNNYYYLKKVFIRSCLILRKFSCLLNENKSNAENTIFLYSIFFHLKLRLSALIEQIRPWIDEMNSNELPNFILLRTGWHSWTNSWSVSMMSVVSKLVENVTEKLGCIWISIIGKEKVKLALKKRGVCLQS